MTQPLDRLPPQFWSAPAVAAALAACDVPVLLTEVRRARGWTQAQLAEMVGYSQSWVSKVLRGRQPLTVDQVREVSIRIGVPLHLLRFGVRGGDDPTRRRDFGKAVALAPLAPLAAGAGSPADNFSGTPARAEVDETTAQTLTSITGARRRLEAGTPSRELARGAVAHVDLAGRVLLRADARVANDVRAGLSEAAGFAAWLHGDMQDLGTARTYYRLAVDSARQAGHSLLAAYMIGSRAAFEVEADDPSLALALLARARRELGDRPPPTARAWLSSIEALGHAA
ncbi:helix-turn-helix domain-containing protein, partial [Nonomuraea lactucae]|uniref:helix-turn-helix domain-containing protein n=1 Tax=Nonomuraea lactucae TaxID=2249762 RepID=UPI001F068209